MVDKARERAMHPVKPFTQLQIKRPNGVTTRVSALGLAQLHPAIDMSRSETTPSGRTRNDYISFTSEEFPVLFDYLRDALKHWEEE